MTVAPNMPLNQGVPTTGSSPTTSPVCSSMPIATADHRQNDLNGINPTITENSNENESSEGFESMIEEDVELNENDGMNDCAGQNDFITDGMQPPPAPRIPLEGFVRCSESLLWKLMMSFYDRKGALAWAHGIVPHFITSNAYITKTYAKILQGFLSDIGSKEAGPMAKQMKLCADEKFYIIELGAGCGKFSFLMLQALRNLRETFNFPIENIVYVMTDFTESNFNFWLGHPSLRPYVESGQLDFALFDAVNDDDITLHHSGVVLSADNPTANPVYVIANYLFDTLCHDIFQVEGGVLKEGLISVGTNRQKVDPLDPDIIQTLANEYRYRAIEPSYYGNTCDRPDNVHLSRILGWYKDKFASDDASILMPVGAIRSLRKLSRMAGGRMLVVSGDKGNNNPDHFRGLVDPHIAVHGSFSVMVNYHAIGSYFTSRGGFALQNRQEEASLKVSCFVLPGSNDVADDLGVDPFLNEGFEFIDKERQKQFPMLKQAFTDFVDAFGPNDFFVMQKCLKEEVNRLTLRSVVSLLKMSNWDADIFYKFRDTILSQIAASGSKLRSDLCQGIPLIWENYFMLDQEKDIAFEIGRFYYGIRHYTEALDYYKLSSEQIGQHHVTFHNMGLCHYSLGNVEVAAEHFKKSISMNSSYEKAASWLEKVTKEMTE